MDKKKVYLISAISILCLIFITAVQITTFSNNLTSENLTFTGNENITRNLSISRYVNVTGAYMNLSSYNSTSAYNKCYQESADTSNQTGIDGNCYLSYTGTYYFPTVAGNTSTWMYINYTKPTDSFNASWKVSKLYGSSSSYNILDSCLKSNILSLYLLATPVPGNFNLKGYCLNSTGWQQLFSANSGALTSEGEDLPNSNNAKDGNWNTGTHWSNSRNAWQNNSFPTVAGIYEEAINWSIYSHPANTSLSINNTNIWNYSGEFNQTNNKTNDFSSALNTAINNGKCDCKNCSIVGNNCSIPFTFHSDSVGILQYSDIQINYDPMPFVYLKSPSNATYSSNTKIFTCNSTDEINLKNITLYIWNSTGIYNNTEFRNISGLTNSTTFNEINFSISDTYTWNCLVLNNGSYSNWYEYNYTLFVDTSNPITTLNYPSNNLWLNNGTNIDFNCTTEGNNLDSEFLYGNFTGTYGLNQTKLGITSGIVNNFKLNLSDNQYSWTCGANKSTTSTVTFSQYGNYTVGIDTIYPVGNNMTISTTAGSQTISFLTNVTDLNLNICTYTIYESGGAINGLNNNVSFSCNVLSSATVTAYGTYTFSVNSIDKANNILNQNLSFTTSPTSSTTVTGGGASSNELTISETFFILNTNLQNIIDVSLAKSSKSPREKTILIYNKGKDEITVKLSCDTKESNASSRDIKICDYVKFSNETIVVSPDETNPTQITFYLFTPDQSDFGESYYFNIIGLDSESNTYAKMSVSSSVGYLSTIFYKFSYWSDFPFGDSAIDFNQEKSTYSVFLVSIILATIVLIGSITIFSKADLLLTGFLIGFTLFFLIFGLMPLII